MPDFVFLNGEFVKPEDARISVFDHGFLYGDGLFETMRAYSGKVFKIGSHLDRLSRSAEALGLQIPYSIPELEGILNELVKLNGDNLYIRLTVSRGPGPVGIDPGLCLKPTTVITSKEITYNDRFYRLGARAIFVKTLRNLAGATMPHIKSLNFLNNIVAKQEVIRAGADEGFMLNHLGQVTEGTVSNVFMVTDGSLLTPAADSGLLVGITRLTVMDLARRQGFTVVEKLLTKDDFYRADEIFYTNSGSELVPVTVLDNKKVGSGKVGPVAEQLLKDYRAMALSGID